MIDKLVTAALLTISLILLTGFNRSSASQRSDELLLHRANFQATEAMNNL